MTDRQTNRQNLTTIEFLSYAAMYPFVAAYNLLNMPAGVVPVTHVHQDDLDALNGLDDNDLGFKEIKQVKQYLHFSKFLRRWALTKTLNVSFSRRDTHIYLVSGLVWGRQKHGNKPFHFNWFRQWTLVQWGYQWQSRWQHWCSLYL